MDFAWTRCPLRPNPLAHNNTACPSHGRGRRFNPYSAHHLRCFAVSLARHPHPKPAKGARRRMRRRSGQVHREAVEIGKRAVAQSAFVRSAQNHAGRLGRLEGFLPSRCAKTPTIAGLEAGKAEFRHRCRKIVAARFREREKRGGHDGAHRVAADVLRTGIAAAVSKEPRHGSYGTGLEPLTEYVARRARPTASITAVVPQHLVSASCISRRLPGLCPNTTIFAEVRDEREFGSIAGSVAAETPPRLFGNTARQICVQT